MIGGLLCYVVAVGAVFYVMWLSVNDDGED